MLAIRVNGPCCDFGGSLCAPHAVMNDVRPDGCRRLKDLISRRTGRNVTMSGWIKIGVEFITALAHQWKGSSHPNPPSETTDSMAAEELAPGVDSVAVRPESQISIKPEASPNQEKSSVAAKLCDSFSIIFGGIRTTSLGHSRSA